MKFINNINKYSYNSNLIDNIELFIKLNNGIDYFGDKYWYINGKIHWRKTLVY
jgi:hypothetical protein